MRRSRHSREPNKLKIATKLIHGCPFQPRHSTYKWEAHMKQQMKHNLLKSYGLETRPMPQSGPTRATPTGDRGRQRSAPQPGDHALLRQRLGALLSCCSSASLCFWSGTWSAFIRRTADRILLAFHFVVTLTSQPVSLGCGPVVQCRVDNPSAELVVFGLPAAFFVLCSVTPCCRMLNAGAIPLLRPSGCC